MKIFADENIPQMTIRSLREMGHDVKDIRGTIDEGIDDEDIWEMVIKEKRLLITTDKGFRHYREEPHSGVLIVQLRQPNRLKIHQRVVQGFQQFTEKEWPGKILIMRDKMQSIWEGKNKQYPGQPLPDDNS